MNNEDSGSREPMKLIICILVFLLYWALVHEGTKYDKDD